MYSALDTRSGQWLNFKRAVELGLLNPEEGTYVDRTSRHQFKLVEAIEKGLIKAAKVTDPKTIELLPLAERGLHWKQQMLSFSHLPNFQISFVVLFSLRVG